MQQKTLSIFGSTKKILSAVATGTADVIELGSDQIKVAKATNKVTDVTEFGSLRTQAIIETYKSSQEVDLKGLPEDIADFIKKSNVNTLNNLMAIKLYG